VYAPAGCALPATSHVPRDSFTNANGLRLSAVLLCSGLAVMTVVFLLYCMIQLRDGLLLRPHPAVWCVVADHCITTLLLSMFCCVWYEV
jgi:hypothetical protein